ncbi:hypothetical protein HJC23_002416 [Cyclotella cryptica]|uniref:Uncharacterized protein n=1 Tax=Cyclotella cryptica TaxID=29204 RepID=A0ABD3QL28_9STRA|eukprot:CCRYP_004523-RB/>CCRYP_004523-RB protein AED:0.16 eAED:0.16 QI:3707/1/1/1/0.66/0.5/4/83/224
MQQNSLSHEHVPKLFDASDLHITITVPDNAISQITPQVILRSKCLVVGDAACGKTSLVKSFSSKEDFPAKYSMTTQVDLTVKTVAALQNIDVDLFVYDVPGQSIFNRDGLQTYHYKDASYILCVFDVSSRRSFEQCAAWINAVTAASPGNKNAEILLVANKVDLRQKNSQFVDSVEGKEYAESRGYKYFECSAKKHQGVESPFQYMANQTHEKYNQPPKVTHKI